MAKFELIKNVCDDTFNQFVVKLLRDQRGWRLCPDEWDVKIENDMKNSAYAKDLAGHSDTGLLLHTYNDAPHEEDSSHEYEGLNTLAQFIFESVMNRSRYVYHDVDLVRILWNYYNRASTGIYHVDKDFADHKYFSVVYHLNTCDGGTFIQKDKIPCVSGNAIIFDSNLQHKGLGPKKEPARYVLNILLKYSRKSKK
jgi:hypothetical protein